MTSFVDSLAEGVRSPLLADGAMGTMLQARGLPPGTLSAGWSLSHPDEVLAVHRAYVAVGCEIVLTNSLGVQAPSFAPEEVAALIGAAVDLARAAGPRWVAGSLGPGADEGAAAALAEGGVDLFWLETQLGLEQALRSVRACQRVAPLPIIVTFTFHRPDGLTHAGERASEIARALENAGVTAIGANCGGGLTGLDRTMESLGGHCTLPLVLKPNGGVAGAPAPAPKLWADEVRRLVDRRVAIVGGCCGTTPAHIGALRGGADSAGDW